MSCNTEAVIFSRNLHYHCKIICPVQELERVYGKYYLLSGDASILLLQYINNSIDPIYNCQ